MNSQKLFIYLIITPIVIKVVFLTENSFNRLPFGYLNKWIATTLLLVCAQNRHPVQRYHSNKLFPTITVVVHMSIKLLNNAYSWNHRLYTYFALVNHYDFNLFLKLKCFFYIFQHGISKLFFKYQSVGWLKYQLSNTFDIYISNYLVQSTL